MHLASSILSSGSGRIVTISPDLEAQSSTVQFWESNPRLIPPEQRRSSTVGVIVPTLNGARWWPQFCEGLLAQNISPSQVLIVDSTSTDHTPDLARESGFHVVSIPRCEFNHGGTRQ